LAGQGGERANRRTITAPDRLKSGFIKDSTQSFPEQHYGVYNQNWNIVWHSTPLYYSLSPSRSPSLSVFFCPSLGIVLSLIQAVRALAPPNSYFPFGTANHPSISQPQRLSSLTRNAHAALWLNSLCHAAQHNHISDRRSTVDFFLTAIVHLSVFLTQTTVCSSAVRNSQYLTQNPGG